MCQTKAIALLIACVAAAGLQDLAPRPTLAGLPSPQPNYAAPVERIDAAGRPSRPAQTGGNQPVDDALTALDAVLSDPNLQRPLATPAPRPTPSERAPELQIPRIGIDAIRLALAIAGSIGVMALIVVAGPTLHRFLAARRRNAAREGDADAEVTTSVEAVARAQHASAIQDYRLAMRMLYLACLLKLDESGALRYDRTQTNREYVRQVARQPALASALQPVVEMFDDAWYGLRRITPELYTAFEARVSALLGLAVAARKPASDEQ